VPWSGVCWQPVLANAPGLEKRVTYCETKIPLGELVVRVAAATGVALTAAPEVADEPVAVVVTDFPARELLDQLADLLDYRWRRRNVVLRPRDLGLESGESNPSDGPMLPPVSPSPATKGPTPKAQGPRPGFEIYQDLH
jgi:hypothetical protein